jgi:hypothetical protein
LDSPSPDKAGDAGLLRGEVIQGRVAAAVRGGAGRGQFLPRPAGERPGAHRLEQVVRGAQLGAGVGAPSLAAQPFPVEQVGAGQRQPHPGPAQPSDRLGVQLLGGVAMGQQGPRAGLEAQPPVRSAGPGMRAQRLQRGLGRLGLVAAYGGFDQLGQRLDHPAGVSAVAGRAVRTRPLTFGA